MVQFSQKNILPLLETLKIIDVCGGAEPLTIFLEFFGTGLKPTILAINGPANPVFDIKLAFGLT
jgi:hypothetical protein